MKKSDKGRSIGALQADERRAEEDLCISILCKNTNQLHTYDFSKKEYAKNNRAILEIVVWAIYKLRDSVGHESRLVSMSMLPKFFSCLEEQQIYDPKLLSTQIIGHFAEWLKSNKRLSYITAARLYRSSASLFRKMNQHPKITEEFLPPRNAFPKSETLQSPNLGFDTDELKKIARAAVQALKKTAPLLTPYEPKWLGKPAPLEDVAPYNPQTKLCSRWSSLEHQIWWWENNCDYSIKSLKEIRTMPNGLTFLRGVSSAKNPNQKSLDDFYQRVGAHENYTPRHLNKPSPILYRTPWKKFDFMIWYWENKLECKIMTPQEFKIHAPEFHLAVRKYWGGDSDFFKKISLSSYIEVIDLIPYYILLLIRTAMNPTTIQRLLTDCLVMDPTDSSRSSIDWTKFRSFKNGRTIPADINRDNWPAMLISRVLEITKFYRKIGQNELWITNFNIDRISRVVSKTSFNRAIKRFSEEINLKGSNGKTLLIRADRIRPSIAMHEYLRTEDLNYLKVLMGHSKTTTTAGYVRRRNDPILLMRRGIHQQAMFFGLTEAMEILPENPLPSDKTSKTNLVDALLNHCQNPLESPVFGEKKGEPCTASSEVCLGCQNLAITPPDIKKFFCFTNFYAHLLSIGEITHDQHHLAISEKKFIWEKYIIPKYRNDFIAHIERDARENPLPEWDITIYESTKKCS